MQHRLSQVAKSVFFFPSLSSRGNRVKVSTRKKRNLPTPPSSPHRRILPNRFSALPPPPNFVWCGHLFRSESFFLAKKLTVYLSPSSFIFRRHCRKKHLVGLFQPGLPDFSWYKIPKPEKMYQMHTKCTKW
jgi:hypothetical protein